MARRINSVGEVSEKRQERMANQIVSCRSTAIRAGYRASAVERHLDSKNSLKMSSLKKANVCPADKSSSIVCISKTEVLLCQYASLD